MHLVKRKRKRKTERHVEGGKKIIANKIKIYINLQRSKIQSAEIGTAKNIREHVREEEWWQSGMTTPEQRNICQFRNYMDSNATWHRWGTGETRPVGVIRMIKREDQEKHRCGKHPGQYWKTERPTGSDTCSVKSVWSSCSRPLRIKLCRWTSARVSQAKNYKARFNKSGLHSCSVWRRYGNRDDPGEPKDSC